MAGKAEQMLQDLENVGRLLTEQGDEIERLRAVIAGIHLLNQSSIGPVRMAAEMMKQRCIEVVLSQRHMTWEHVVRKMEALEP